MKEAINVKKIVVIAICLIVFVIIVSVILKLTFFKPKPITEIKKTKYILEVQDLSIQSLINQGIMLNLKKMGHIF